jgi:hypothetical protein
MQFIQQTQILDRNLMILRDLNHCCYQRGISAQQPTIASFLRWQAHVIKAKFPKVSEVYCIGSSGGAYAALLSGHFLKVKKVWAFAPPVPVETSEYIAYVDAQFGDLSRVLDKDNGTTEYEIFFNESLQSDRAAAERLRDLPGVTLSPQGGEGHAVVIHLAKTGRLKSLLPAFVSQ